MTPAVNTSIFSFTIRIISTPTAYGRSLTFPYCESRYSLRRTLGHATHYRARNHPNKTMREVYGARSVLAGDTERFGHDTLRGGGYVSGD